MIVISITLLLIINLKITTTIIIFFSLACAIFLFLTKLRVNKLANQRFKFEGQKVKSINEGLNGLIDIKLSGKISFFKNIYFIVENFLKKNYINFNFLIALPKVWIEFLTIAAFLFFSFFLINYSDSKFISFVPLIGIYALSAFKLMPSFNRILVNYNTTKFTRKVFMNILLELKKMGKEKRRKSNKNIKTINNFKIQNLSFRYVKKKAIFNNLNLRFKK